MTYKHVDHATDAIVEVSARDLDEAFAQAAEAVADITLDRSKVAESERRELRAEGRSVEILLLDWLEAANYLIITEGFAARRFEASVSGGGPYAASGAAYGEPLDPARHGFRIEVKAPTLHMMDVECARGSARLRFLLDL